MLNKRKSDQVLIAFYSVNTDMTLLLLGTDVVSHAETQRSAVD